VFNPPPIWTPVATRPGTAAPFRAFIFLEITGRKFRVVLVEIPAPAQQIAEDVVRHLLPIGHVKILTSV
jgi:hypothetical protein